MIKKYDPMLAPDPEEWVALSERERIDLIMQYHIKQDIDLPNNEMHSSIHAVIEYQVAMGDEYPVKATLNRLMNEGLDRHNAIHAIGHVLIKYLWEVGTGENTSENFSEDYFDEVSELTAQKWYDEFGE